MILVSIIMPVYNGEAYLFESIQSVLLQSHSSIELLIINDGSADRSETIVRQFNDPRLRYFKQVNKGVGAARNLGLKNMKGEYFCFLDADDVMPKDSIESRLQVFKHQPSLAFVGGSQVQMDATLEKVLSKQVPSYKGYPQKGLIRVDPSCFINCGTWLIKHSPTVSYTFQEGWTHSEDLAFFYSISHQGELGFTEKVVQIYRRSVSTAMQNLDGLAEGYERYYNLVTGKNKIVNKDVLFLKYKIIRIMFLSYFRAGKIRKSFNVLFKFLFL